MRVFEKSIMETSPVENDLIRRPPSLSEIAYGKIKSKILNLELMPSEAIYADLLAAQLGISRTPIREALKKLQTEGFVELRSNGSTIVTPITINSTIQIFDVRKPLECLAVRLAANNIPESVIVDLKSLLDHIAGNAELNQWMPYFKSDTSFHQAIIDASGNEWLSRMLIPLNEQVFRIRCYAQKITGEHLVAAFSEHRKILAALEHKNASLAEELMANHVQKSGERICEILIQMGIT